MAFVQSLAGRGMLAVLLAGLAVVSASAQAGRVGGIVRDEAGQPIKGAVVRADNPNATPNSFTSTTDDRGRFSMLGLKSGRWTFTAEAPGFLPIQGQAQIQTLAVNPPMAFTLTRAAASAPPTGALAGVNTKELQAELEAAENLVKKGALDDALGAYRAILAKAPALTLINLQIAAVLRQKKDYDGALAAYQEVLTSDPNNERARIAIGMTYMEKGDLQAAETALTAAAETVSASREVFYNLGEVKFSKGQTEDAAKYYQRAADMDPAWGKPLFKLGLVAVNKGDKEGAIKLMEKVLSVDPNSAEAAQAKGVLEQLRKS
jgi:tetratricopeptide (TPR) repeat protein